ncbi:hypothetical protein MLD38_033820 [Melastoma candidum]|uniref:Uncharacterized protein n=1 Tax=Melastoma candidum TaxID=119954 RepID=A0ACB9M7N0_9MYRT|nr:hypothetical protein MLD38_033820 [Melastoma candidum]
MRNQYRVLQLQLVASCFLSAILKHNAQVSRADDPNYVQCGSMFRCGNLQGITYPFWGANRPAHCGLPEFQLTCDGSNTTPQITFTNQVYRVLAINNITRVMTVARRAYWFNFCPRNLHNSSKALDPFSYTPDTLMNNLTLYYGCPTSQIPIPALASNQFTCTINATTLLGYFLTRDVRDIASSTNLSTTASVNYFEACNTSVVIPVNASTIPDIENSPSLSTLTEALRQGFGLQWPADDGSCQRCISSGGHCGRVNDSRTFSCYCPDQPHSSICPGQNDEKKFSTLDDKTATATVLAAMVVILVALLSYRIRNKCWLAGRSILKEQENDKHRHGIESIIRSHGTTFPRKYTYRDLKKLTNSFSEKLGEGGFGMVYKGELKEKGNFVAVKMLKESKGDDGDFINEVASISRTAHVNVVELVGFCYEGNKRALLYDYMPNGSLDKLLELPDLITNPLRLKILHHVAIGIARGLEYLHRGCNTQILHFDIKPQNILLDQDFTPKISDFGLAKLCRGRESVVSMVGVRGTVGYIAPELCCGNFGGVSHKSDVYSYGMLVFKIIGMRSATEYSQSSEAYLPERVYNHLKFGTALQMPEIDLLEEREMARKMMLVGLWCIQTHPSNRPSMSRVIEMLEGSIQQLEVPPKPLFFSSETTSSSGNQSAVSPSRASSSLKVEEEAHRRHHSMYAIQTLKVRNFWT